MDKPRGQMIDLANDLDDGRRLHDAALMSRSSPQLARKETKFMSYGLHLLFMRLSSKLRIAEHQFEGDSTP